MKKILVVEDNPDLQESMEALLCHNHYEVKLLSNGAEVALSLEKELPDLILMDVMMPKKSGIEVCRELKSDARTRAIPVILLSAKAQKAEIEAGLKAGADQYVTKPYTNDQLLKTIAAFFSVPA